MSPVAVPVVNYHSVTSEPVAGFEEWEVTPQVFAAQIGHLVDTGYDVIPLAQYANDKPVAGSPQPTWPSSAVAISASKRRCRNPARTATWRSRPRWRPMTCNPK